MVTIASREVCLQQRNTSLKQPWGIASLSHRMDTVSEPVNRHDAWFNQF